MNSTVGIDRGRRRFLRQLGAAAMAGWCAPSWAVQQRGIDEPVLVLGAGLAGLYAALQLRRAGVPVIVIEARHRVGGRVFTLDHLPGHPEGGANTVGPNYGRLISTARRLGVTLQPQARGAAMGLMLDGERIDRESWPDSPHNTLPARLRQLTPDRLAAGLLRDNPLTTSWSWRAPEMAALDQSAEAYFRAQGLDERALGWLDANNSYGNRLRDTSLLSLYRVSASIGRAMSMRQPALEANGGNSRLPEAMAAELADVLVMGEQVTHVRQRPGGVGDVSVQCRSGRRFEGAALVCTLPLPALRELSFEPGLAPPQAQAIASVDYHKVTQAHFLVHERYWEQAGEPPGWWTDGPLGRIFVRSGAEGQPDNLTCWINGDQCDRYDGLAPADAQQLLVDDFLRRVPAARGKVELAHMVSWQREALNRGSWAIWQPGQIGRHADALALPHGRVVFAGEHTAYANAGMEGALESGERAALETLRMLA